MEECVFLSIHCIPISIEETNRNTYQCKICRKFYKTHNIKRALVHNRNDPNLINTLRACITNRLYNNMYIPISFFEFQNINPSDIFYGIQKIRKIKYTYIKLTDIFEITFKVNNGTIIICINKFMNTKNMTKEIITDKMNIFNIFHNRLINVFPKIRAKLFMSYELLSVLNLVSNGQNSIMYKYPLQYDLSKNKRKEFIDVNEFQIFNTITNFEIKIDPKYLELQFLLPIKSFENITSLRLTLTKTQCEFLMNTINNLTNLSELYLNILNELCNDFCTKLFNDLALNVTIKSLELKLETLIYTKLIEQYLQINNSIQKCVFKKRLCQYNLEIDEDKIINLYVTHSSLIHLDINYLVYTINISCENIRLLLDNNKYIPHLHYNSYCVCQNECFSKVHIKDPKFLHNKVIAHVAHFAMMEYGDTNGEKYYKNYKNYKRKLSSIAK